MSTFMHVFIFNICSSLWFHIIAFHSLICTPKTSDNTLKHILVTHAITSIITGFILIASVLNIHIYRINGRDVNLLRYIEWLLCTPLLTSEICQAGHFDYVNTVIILILTASFCLCGILAAMTHVLWAKIVLGAQGTVYSLIVIKILLKHAFQETNGSQMNTINKINIITTTCIWPLFVVTWGFGPDVYNIITGEQELIIETTLSLLLKSVSGLYAFLVYSEFDIYEFGDTVVATLQNYI